MVAADHHAHLYANPLQTNENRILAGDLAGNPRG